MIESNEITRHLVRAGTGFRDNGTGRCIGQQDHQLRPVALLSPDRMTGAILRVQVGGVLAEIDANKGNVFHDGLR